MRDFFVTVNRGVGFMKTSSTTGVDDASDVLSVVRDIQREEDGNGAGLELLVTYGDFSIVIADLEL